MIMGLDIGYSNLKVALGQGDGQPRQVLHPAGAAPADRMPERIGGDDDAIRVLVDDAPYAACVSPDRLENWNRVLHEDYPNTPSYRALYHAALLLCGQEAVQRVVTGLPVSQYQDRERRAALAAALRGEHRITPKRTVAVEEVQVVPQPVGGYLDLVWRADDPGLLDEARVLVLDPGFFSVDWVLVAGGEVRHASSGTSHQAASVILERANRLLAEDHGGRVGRERLEQALRRGHDRVLLFGRPVEIAPYLRQAARQVVPVAVEALREALRNEMDGIDVVVIGGGGAGFYEEAIRELFPRSRVVVPPEPVFANARGFWFFGSRDGA